MKTGFQAAGTERDEVAEEDGGEGEGGAYESEWNAGLRHLASPLLASTCLALDPYGRNGAEVQLFTFPRYTGSK
jgi:hypothetical protein